MTVTARPRHGTWGDSARRIAAPLILATTLGTSPVLAADTAFGLLGQYMLDDRGDAAILIDKEQIDPVINFATNPLGQSPWSTGGSRDFSVVWSGTLVAPEAGTYILSLTGTHSYRLWVSGIPTIVRMGEDRLPLATMSATMSLSANMPVPIQIRTWQGTERHSLKFEWITPGATAPTIVPASVLRPTGALFLTSQSQNFESPTSVYAHHVYNHPPVLTSDRPDSLVGSPIELGTTTRYTDVRLHPLQPTVVTATSRGQSARTTLTWDVIDLAQTVWIAPLSIRAGSAILVRSPAADDDIQVLDEYESEADAHREAVAPGLWKLTFPTSGIYRVSLDSIPGKHLDIQVVAIDIPEPFRNLTVPIQVGQRTFATIPITPRSAVSDVRVMTYAHNANIVQLKDDQDQGAPFATTTWALNSPYTGVASLGTWGPVLGLGNLNGFKQWSGDAVITGTDAQGNLTAYADLYIFPFYPTIQTNYTLRNHRCSFVSGGASGGKTLSAHTNGTPTSLGGPGYAPEVQPSGEIFGRLRVPLSFAPNESKWCYTVDAFMRVLP